ncbi:MAG: NUDIX domain-containing protein [Candidatus Pacebacteria bacterium]|nr:NUDIX domain-containing protein [Candidatus Paceibacterota bacterium]
MNKERFKTINAVYLILIEGGKILLSDRLNTGYFDGFYSLPAGHVEKGETLKEAMIREAKEELGINLLELDLVHVMYRNILDKERISFFFKCKKYQGVIKNMEAEKCDDLSWFDVNDLPENMIPYTKEAVNYYLNKVPYSERED